MTYGGAATDLCGNSPDPTIAPYTKLTYGGLDNSKTYQFRIYLDNIKETSKKLKDQKNQYQYSDYQKSERDFAFVIDKNFKVQDLVSIISEIDKNLIKSVKVFDVYEGENIPDDKKSIALNVTIQSSEKTLKDEDLEKINKLIVLTVESKSGAKIRS